VESFPRGEVGVGLGIEALNKGSQKVGQMISQTKLQIKKTSACVRDLTSQEFSTTNQCRLFFLLFYLSFDLPAQHVVADKLAY